MRVGPHVFPAVPLDVNDKINIMYVRDLFPRTEQNGWKMIFGFVPLTANEIVKMSIDIK